MHQTADILITLIPVVLILSVSAWPVYDIVQSHKSTENKVLWVAIVLLFPFFGALAYLMPGRD